MAGEYIIDFTDPANGSFTINAIETEGPNSVNLAPLVSADNDASLFTIAADFTYRFTAGFIFDVINSLAGNNGTYTTVSSVYQGASPIFNINAFTFKFTIAAADYTTIFTSGRIFKISGSLAPTSNDGYWITASSLFVAGNTEITVETVVPTGYRSGTTIDDSEGIPTGNIITNLTAIVVDPTSYSILGADVNSDSFIVASDVSTTFISGREFVVAGTPSNDGTYLTVSSDYEPSYTINAVIVGLGGTWTVSGNHEGEFVVGGSITVTGNTGGGNGVYTIASVANAGANTDIVVTGTIPALSTADGTLTSNGITIIYTSAIVATQLVAAGTLTTNNPLYSIGIPDGQIEYTLPGSTSLSLPGRGALNYGDHIVSDLVHSLEHFAAAVPPPAPIQGQLWYDNLTPAPFVFGSDIFPVIGVDSGTGTWTIAQDQTTVFFAGQRIAVYYDLGLTSVNGIIGGTITYQILSVTYMGPLPDETEIVIDPVPTNPIDATSILPTATGLGRLYNMDNWKRIAFLSDVFSLDAKQSVRAATTVALPAYTYNNGAAGVGATITATVNGALPFIDGVDLNPLDRVLIRNEVGGNAPYNGFYVVSQKGDGFNPFILTRATDADNSSNLTPGSLAIVEEGITYEDNAFILATDAPIIVGTTPLTFILFPVTPISSLVDAEKDNTINNSDWNQVWNWELVADEVALEIGETAASTGGTGTQYLTRFITVDGSTGSPFVVTTEAGDVVEETNNFRVFRTATTDGYEIQINANNSATGSPGDISLAAGDALAPSVVNGGNISLSSGSTRTGIGGTISLAGGNATVSGGQGGSIQLLGGTGFTNTPGSIAIQGGGASSASPVNGGVVTIKGGDGASTGVGGQLTLEGGLSLLGTGGNVDITGGDGVTAGSVNIFGGTSTGGAGGSITITAANGVGLNQNGGNLTFTAGTKTGTGTDGIINLIIPATGTLQINSDPGTAGYALVSNGPTAPATWQLIAANTTQMTNMEGIAISIGQPVYVSGNDQVSLANASDDPQATVTIGLVYDTTIANAVAGAIATSGHLTATTGEWDAITGQVGGLTPGTIYYLDETDGMMTTTAPVTLNSWVVPIGIALSTTKFKINILTPIQN